MTSDEQLFKNLRSFIQKVVPAMPEEEIRVFASKARPLQLEKGRFFVKEGEICCHLLFIHRGLCRYYVLHEGHDLTKDFSVDTHNSFCTAYTSLMRQKPSEIWIEALEPCETWAWNKSIILPLFEEHFLWLLFAKRMVERLFFRKEQKELQQLKCSAEERYRHFLAHFPGLSQRVPQYHIATYLGITPESLSRIRSKIAKDPSQPLF